MKKVVLVLLLALMQISSYSKPYLVLGYSYDSISYLESSALSTNSFKAGVDFWNYSARGSVIFEFGSGRCEVSDSLVSRKKISLEISQTFMPTSLPVIPYLGGSVGYLELSQGLSSFGDAVFQLFIGMDFVFGRKLKKIFVEARTSLYRTSELKNPSIGVSTGIRF